MPPPLPIWDIIHKIIFAFWDLTNQSIEDAALTQGVSVELCNFGELGMEYFSVEDFRRRDPYTNFEMSDTFNKWHTEGWLETTEIEGRYRVKQKTRDAVSAVFRAGDDYLATLDILDTRQLEHLVDLMHKVVSAYQDAIEPPAKWALMNRFRVIDKHSPTLGKIREYALDFFARRDDAHLAAWQPYAIEGYVWNAFSQIWSGKATTIEAIAEVLEWRGYTVEDYALAIEDLCRRGWIELSEVSNDYIITSTGQTIRDDVEQSTNGYFYEPMLAVLHAKEVYQLYNLAHALYADLKAVLDDQDS